MTFDLLLLALKPLILCDGCPTAMAIGSTLFKYC